MECGGKREHGRDAALGEPGPSVRGRVSVLNGAQLSAIQD